MPDTLIRARWFPEMPPMLPDESSGEYTDRLTGADRTGRIPYDHDRNRQCSIGYHGECSDLLGGVCECPCHTEAGRLEMRVCELEESVVALYAIATGRLPEGRAKRPGWAGRILAGEGEAVGEITARRPKLADWYLTPAPESTGEER